MKNNPLTTLLLGLLLVSAVAALVLLWLYGTAVRERRVLQPQVAGVQANHARVAQLAADLTEYSKTHPAIDPILESVGIKAPKGGAAVPPTAAPTRPATR